MSTTGDKLWPLLSVLAVMLSSAIGIEVYARTREPLAIVIAIRGQASSEDEDDEGLDDPGQSAQDTAAPLSAEHAHARALGRRGDLPEAIATFERELEKHPEAAALHADLGYFLLVAGRTSDAVKQLSQARDLGSTSPYTYLNLGVGLRRAGDHAGAGRALNRALALRPTMRAARLALATVLRVTRRFGEAIALLQELGKTGGNAARAEARVALGRAHLAAGDGAAATRAFDEAVEWMPSDALVRIAIARAYLRSEKTGGDMRALSFAEAAVHLAPDLASAHSTLGRAKEAASDAAGARQAYETAVRLNEAETFPRRRLLRIALSERDFDQARAHGERLLAQAPQDPEHHFLMGLLEARAGKPVEARARYLAAIEAAADDYPEAYFNLARLEKDEGRIAEAIAAYRKAIAHKPDYLSAWNNLGLAHATAKNDTAAEDAYRRALAIDARYWPAWLNLGKLELRRKHAAAAIDAFQRAVAIRPQSQEASLELGVAYRRANRTDDAIATYRKLIATQPRYVSAYYNLGIALAHAGKPRDARAAYEQALSLDEDHEPSLRNLGELLLREGQLDAAADRYQAIIDRSPSDRRAHVALAEIHRRSGNRAQCDRELRAALVVEPRTDSPARCESRTAAIDLRL